MGIPVDQQPPEDYLKVPGRTLPSFHNRTGKEVVTDAPTNTYGYPIPGVQSPNAASVMAQDYFVTDATWQHMMDHGDFDYIVVGSGCTALAFIDEALRLDPNKKILCLERGDFWLPSHFQNLPLPFKMVLGGPSETFPWTLSGKTFNTKELKYCHGSCPFFGGRSAFWSAWCPRPTEDLMRAFPESMLKTARSEEFWEGGKRVLHVTSANDIDDQIFGKLQKVIDARLSANLKHVPTAQTAGPAQLAVGRRSPTSTMRFNKFSTPGPMFALFEDQRKKAAIGEGSPLELMVNCTARTMGKDDDGVVRYLETSKGILSWQTKDTKVILCSGAFPNATLLLNSFEECRDTVGKRVTAHFLTHIAARCPLSHFNGMKPKDTLQIAALYLAGEEKDTKQQYHVQITALNSPNPETDADDAARECPDYAAAATYDQLKGSEDYVVFVCASLGEFTENNKENFFKLNKGTDPTCNVTLQFTLSPEDRRLWDVMDEATYQTIEAMSGGNLDDIDYWDETSHSWIKAKPHVDTIRIPGIVHEASTAYVGPKDAGGSLDEYYRPHGIKNVHVAGGAIFPTAGSWNPTLTMCAYAQDLARKLEETKNLSQI